MEINFDLSLSDQLVTIVSNENELIVVIVSKDGNFTFHSESKFSDQINKLSSSIIFGISDFDDKSVCDIELELSDVFESPCLHFNLNAGSVGIGFGSDSL
jgi:hypothetical protein